MIHLSSSHIIAIFQVSDVWDACLSYECVLIALRSVLGLLRIRMSTATKHLEIAVIWCVNRSLWTALTLPCFLWAGMMIGMNVNIISVKYQRDSRFVLLQAVVFFMIISLSSEVTRHSEIMRKFRTLRINFMSMIALCGCLLLCIYFVSHRVLMFICKVKEDRLELCDDACQKAYQRHFNEYEHVTQSVSLYPWMRSCIRCCDSICLPIITVWTSSNHKHLFMQL